jgi:hypothetical protein
MIPKHKLQFYFLHFVQLTVDSDPKRSGDFNFDEPNITIYFKMKGFWWDIPKFSPFLTQIFDFD